MSLLKPRRSGFAPEPARGRPPRFSEYRPEMTREFAETSEVWFRPGAASGRPLRFSEYRPEMTREFVETSEVWFRPGAGLGKTSEVFGISPGDNA
ncbi:hypothetical protein QUF80_17230 [Desulfococcaceae bacterium HSG8]|nr:hypothetical protein [Desulfococcaceae bacterium HSG8]